MDKYPQLKMVARKRLLKFIQEKDFRVKDHTPSLGELLCLLSVSDTVSWRQIGLAFLRESFDRSVLWSCTKDQSLAKVSVGEESRLDRFLATQRVSMRLHLFHSAFLHLLVRGGGSTNALEDC